MKDSRLIARGYQLTNARNEQLSCPHATPQKHRRRPCKNSKRAVVTSPEASGAAGCLAGRPRGGPDPNRGRAAADHVAPACFVPTVAASADPSAAEASCFAFAFALTPHLIALVIFSAHRSDFVMMQPTRSKTIAFSNFDRHTF